MRSERRSQLEKFNTKWSKSEADLEALKRAEIEKQRIIENEHNGINAKPLVTEGGIKEAAAVFTREGMNVFAQIFTNSVESAINKALNDNLESMLERIMERKLSQALDGATEAIMQYASEMGKQRANDLIQKAFDSNIMADIMTPNTMEPCNLGQINIFNGLVTEKDVPESTAQQNKQEPENMTPIGDFDTKKGSNHHWNPAEDEILAREVLEAMANPKDTQIAAFARVSEILTHRSASSCSFRWNNNVRKQYSTEIGKAKTNRRITQRNMNKK